MYQTNSEIRMNLKDTNASVLEVKIGVVSYHIQLDTHTHIQVCMHGCTHAHTHQVPWDGISACMRTGRRDPRCSFETQRTQIPGPKLNSKRRKHTSWLWWHMLVIPAIIFKKKGPKSKYNMSNIVRHYLQNKDR